jgi:NAD(P) transhydrogenase subunit alpha
MEFMPRITRAQSMDVLSSQANLAGYRAVIDAAHEFARAFPMMMTAAGTVAPAKIFVMGAGVAGLQAIATARRLGAVVTATDVRRAAGEQVQSLGAKFIMVETAEDMETEGGYAKELSAEDQKRQAELVANHVKGQDIVVTTALIPGRPAPKLITKAMVESMKPGSLVVDIAAAQGGNCELTEPDQIVEHGGVKIIGYANVPSRVAMDASALYARNLFNFLSPMVDAEKKALAVDWEDELVKGTLATKDGAVVHPNLKDVVKGGTPAAKKSASTAKSTARSSTKSTTTRKAAASKSTAKSSSPPKAKGGARKSSATKTNGKTPPSGDQNDS